MAFSLSLSCSGVTFTINFLAINASGAGILTFLGGGVGIFVGCVWSASLGVLSHFGSGVGIFEGGGVLVLSGGVFSVNLGVAIECGTGVMISMGGGTLTATGVTQELSAGVDFFAGAGVFNWVGAGSAVFVGLSQSRTVGVAGVYGLGGGVCVGAGDLVVVGAASADNYGVASLVLMGADWFLGAGLLVEIGAPLVKNVGVLFAVLFGIDTFLGAGTAVVGWSPARINVGKAAWINPGASLYFVNGKKVAPDLKTFWVDKNGVAQPWKHFGHRLLAATSEKAPTRLLADMATRVGEGKAGLHVLQGSNSINAGMPNAFVAQLQALPGAETQTLNVSFATLNGNATTCNACGFKGDVASEFLGDGAGACANTQADDPAACSLIDAHVALADGTMAALPTWMQAATKLYNPFSGKTDWIDTSVVTSVLKVGCSVDHSTATAAVVPSTCLDTARMLEALRQSLSTVGNGCARVNLQNKNSATHPEIEANDNWAEAFAGSAHTDIFDLSFTIHNTACTAVVTAWLDKFTPETFLTMLGEVAPAGVHLDATDLSVTKVHNVKGTDLAGAAKQMFAVMAAAAADTGLPTLLVNGAATAADKEEKASITSTVNRLALPKITAGEEAVVALANFYQAQPVTMALTTKCILGMAATAAKDSVVALGSFAPLDQISVPIPTNTTPGIYSLRATQNGLS